MHPVLLMNPKSGDGKVKRFGLADACASLGIDVVVVGPGDDLRSLALAAAQRPADVMGMAGGDGSLAVVASVAAARGIPFVCVPVGTRNHFALDMGLDRGDPVGALDAFGPARERLVDLATVNGRTFVNNVSLGLYGTMVGSKDYRAEKLKTAAETIQQRLGPKAPPYDLHLEAPDGPVEDPQVVEVSNNPYVLRSLTTFGERVRMDSGTLGVVTLRVGDPADLEHLLGVERDRRFERFPGLHSWTTAELEVRSSSPVPAGVDGESCHLTPPLRFQSVPRALRVRVPRTRRKPKGGIGLGLLSGPR
jgi:diacylglycerol kinase family enzyme